MVLLDQGIPLRRSGHPTCPYSDQNFMGPQKGLLGQNEPFWGPRSISRGPRAHDIHVTHPVGPASDSWDYIRALGSFEDLQGPPRTSRAPKRPFWASGGTYMAPGWAKMTCNYVIHVGSDLRSFEAFHGNIWSVAPFIPVGM